MQDFETGVMTVDERFATAVDPGSPTSVTGISDADRGAAGSGSIGPAVADPVVLRRGTIIRIPGMGRLVPLLRLQMGFALVLLNLADVMLTKILLHNGAAEANPLMAPIMPGTAAPIGAKTLVPGLAAILLVMCPSDSKLADRAVATVLGIYVAIVMWNCVLLTHLSL